MGVQLADTHQDPSLVDELPLVFQRLLRAEQLLLNCAAVEGTFFVECFHGDGAVSLACLIKGIPCICPFDTQYGDEFDLLKNSEVLNELVRTERVGTSHIGRISRQLDENPYCGSLKIRKRQDARARESLS